MPTLFDKSVRYLAGHAEEILKHQNEQGEFWPDAGFRTQYNTDYQQFAYYPLAWLYTLDHPENQWKEDPRLLTGVERSFKNNLRILTDTGAFIGSSHDAAPHAWPNNWRSFTWLRAWELMRACIEPALSATCEAGLRKALIGIHGHAKKETSQEVHCRNHNVRNHPVWHVLATLSLARAFDDQARATWAVNEMERICAAQHPAGIWFEHDGPVAVYQHVTMSGLAHYHALTGSPAAAEALNRALGFYRIFTYPSGYPIETLDGRVRYTGYVMSIVPATWGRSADGRAYLHFILDRLLKQPLGPCYQTHGGWLGLPFFTQFARDLSLPEYKEESSGAAVSPISGDGVHAVPNLPVRVIRKGPWTATLSGFTRPETPKNRWELDYQAHVSIFHEHCGLIVGGGGGKRQAALSLFTGGSRPLGLPCLAQRGEVETIGAESVRLRLQYPDFAATIEVHVENDARLRLSARVHDCKPSAGSVFLQLPFPMKGDGPIVTAAGARLEMDLQDELLPEEIGAWIGREGKFRIGGVGGGRALIHFLPFNTHWRDGRAPAEKAMAIVALPLEVNSTRTVIFEPDGA